MFRTSKCSSSGRLVHTVLWYFFYAEIIIIIIIIIIIKGYMICLSIKYKFINTNKSTKWFWFVVTYLNCDNIEF
jgi:hypothetical protein